MIHPGDVQPTVDGPVLAATGTVLSIAAIATAVAFGAPGFS